MKSGSMTAASTSKPKIHRFPPKPPRKSAQTPSVEKKPGKSGWFVLAAATVLLTTITFIVLIGSPGPGRSRQDMRESIVTEPIKADVSPLAIQGAVASPLSPEEQEKTIVIQEGGDAIVGQMAKLPPTSQSPSEIETISKVDKQAGRELLSIINKY
jgi:hypothetical protein